MYALTKNKINLHILTQGVNAHCPMIIIYIIIIVKRTIAHLWKRNEERKERMHHNVVEVSDLCLFCIEITVIRLWMCGVVEGKMLHMHNKVHILTHFSRIPHCTCATVSFFILVSSTVKIRCALSVQGVFTVCGNWRPHGCKDLRRRLHQFSAV